VRVLVVTNMWPSPERPEQGGFVRDQVESLRRLDGLELELFAFHPSGGLWPYVTAARELRRRYRGERFDVVHAHYGLTGWSALAVRGSPRMVTFHGTDLHHRVAGPLSRALVRLIDLPATVSARLAREPGAGVPGAGRARRVAVLPMGVNLERFEPIGRQEARRRLGLDPDSRFLLFPADPARPEKRHDRAEELARTAGVELLTYSETDPEEVPSYVNAANAVVVTSEREGFGLACLEALACDVPVLATPVGIAPLALEGVAGTLCAPFDAAAWRRALAPHLESEDPRIAGRGRAALFDRDRMARRVFEVYGAIVRDGRSL
jgi:teichuronic acid biosynthesis glycosyltransferase TuaC